MYNTRPRYIMLVGLPASGKTTFRIDLNELAKVTSGESYVVLSTDDYIEQFSAKKQMTYSDVFKYAIPEAELLMKERMKSAMEHGLSIIHDQTNLTRKKREAILSQIPEEYYKICEVIHCSDEEERQRRLQRPGKQIPEDVDKRMRESYQQPSHEEGWDAIFYHDTMSV